jgi:hypothetical protein
MRKKLIHGSAKVLYYLQIGGLGTTTDIVGLPQSTFTEDHPDGFAMIFHKQPIAYLTTIPINGECLSILCIEDHERDELFGELIWAIII